MAVKELNQDNFKQEISQGYTFVDLWADWCTPCKMIAPSVEALSEEMPDVKFAKLDTDAHPEIANEFGVRSIPTLLLFKDGQLVDRVVGAVPKSVLATFLLEKTGTQPAA